MGVGFTTTGLKQELVTAQEPKINNQQIAYVNNWQNASFPVENFQGYTSPFGPRGGGFHYGLDLAAPRGSYIRNWWAGKVVEVWEDRRCGTGIVVKSGYWEHVYCHVQGRVETHGGRRYLVDRGGGIMLLQGQVLPAGTRIARVGMTGRTSGPHLHWGLKYGGRWVDPGLILREMYAQQTRNLSGLQGR
ncbi:M23 family metallopeptidase [Okeania sp. KiyG1]|uniref:M23 family metallopeptidase n=1 Tax=Okeania sp. KiyG1 TaxID=2720165 RepID=UPI0035C91BCF